MFPITAATTEKQKHDLSMPHIHGYAVHLRSLGTVTRPKLKHGLVYVAKDQMKVKNVCLFLSINSRCYADVSTC